MVQAKEKTRKHGIGIRGHINNAARGVTAKATLGASNLIWKEATGTEKTKAVNKKIAICQNCGHSWTVKQR